MSNKRLIDANVFLKHIVMPLNVLPEFKTDAVNLLETGA